MKRALLGNIKNIPGWSTGERLVVLSIDDFGNVRVGSAEARAALIQAGLNMSGRFDRYDSLETKTDLEMLLDVLRSAIGGDGRAAVVTAYTNCANPDFQRLADGGDHYRYLSLPETFAVFSAAQPSAYEHAWSIWQEGIREGLMQPQFHGREHLNVHQFESMLRREDPSLLRSIRNYSIAGLTGENIDSEVKITEAFAFADESEIDSQKDIIVDGLRLFREVFEFDSQTVTPPGTSIHPNLYHFLVSQGVRGIDKPRVCARRVSRARHKLEFNILGPNRSDGHSTIVRNVVFEPTLNRDQDAVSSALKQVERAFRWRKPAIVSSHRVNFCGHIDPENRRFGIESLGRLLQCISRKWPDARYVTADELVGLMVGRS